MKLNWRGGLGLLLLAAALFTLWQFFAVLIAFFDELPNSALHRYLFPTGQAQAVVLHIGEQTLLLPAMLWQIVAVFLGLMWLRLWFACSKLLLDSAIALLREKNEDSGAENRGENSLSALLSGRRPKNTTHDV